MHTPLQVVDYALWPISLLILMLSKIIGQEDRTQCAAIYHHKNGCRTIEKKTKAAVAVFDSFLQTFGKEKSFIFQSLMRMVQRSNDYKNTVTITNHPRNQNVFGKSHDACY